MDAKILAYVVMQACSLPRFYSDPLIALTITVDYSGPQVGNCGLGVENTMSQDYQWEKYCFLKYS
ncbi:hypothetical protein IC229_21240 [Spirosoma sp. BT702]|uniref:Uncharacterized protein n=1 Tax=Spirosoma profusum TaxID=2771354 RepID=A0A927AP37_9BACT|nr:hypothetical protein [Spirosoma profusum]MBD2703184.1 hypothetical protein [Spirosoma profusum]